MDLAAATAFLMKVFGKKEKEGFQETPKEEKQVKPYGVIGMVIVFVYFIVLFLQSCAGARLSWCYNQSIGTGTALAVFYAILCFFFPGFYMVLYTFFLSPMCAGEESKTNLVENIVANASRPLIGGRRR